MGRRLLTAAVDSSGFSAFQDSKKRNFMEKFVMPEAIRILESRLKVTSNSIIPAFDPEWNYCDDQGKLTVDSKYKTQTTEGDFLLLVGVINEPNSGTLAYATYCLNGRAAPGYGRGNLSPVC